MDSLFSYAPVASVFSEYLDNIRTSMLVWYCGTSICFFIIFCMFLIASYILQWFIVELVHALKRLADQYPVFKKVLYGIYISIVFALTFVFYDTIYNLLLLIWDWMTSIRIFSIGR